MRNHFPEFQPIRNYYGFWHALLDVDSEWNDESFFLYLSTKYSFKFYFKWFCDLWEYLFTSQIKKKQGSYFKTFYRLDHAKFQFEKKLFFLVLNQQFTGRHVAPLKTHYPDSEPTSLCSYSLILCTKQRAANTNFIVFGLTHLGLESLIYHTQGEHANHDTSGAILFFDENIY